LRRTWRHYVEEKGEVMDSVQHLEQLVISHGYWGVFIGTLFEGETILIIGGLCAKLGLLKLFTVVSVAFIGSFSGDQICFFMGYFKGRQILRKHPRWELRVDKVHNRMKRYQTLIMLGFRFVYGMRMMTPFVIGLDRNVRVMKFFILNAIGAAIWSVVVAVGGYFFGYAVESFVKNVKQFQMYAIVVVGVIGTALWAIHRYRSKKLLEKDVK
jgi:membrane protein DedA with SNARE-associated domain